MNNRLWAIICVTLSFSLSLSLVMLTDTIQTIHLNGQAYWFASDPGEYMRLYEVYSYAGGFTDHALKLSIVGAPILMLLISGGIVSPILILANTVFFFSLYSCLKYISNGKGVFFLLMVVNPVILFGFFAINKEIFLISSILLLLAYYRSLSTKYLLLCVALIVFSRAYMLVVILFLLLVFPPGDKVVRWKLLVVAVVFASLIAPFILGSGKLGTGGDLLKDSGIGARFFSTAISNYLYGLVYFPKYLFLMLMRAWSAYVSGFVGEYKSNLRDLLTSLYSFGIFIYTIINVHYYRSLNFKYLMMAIWAPLPLMFSDIAHWRYYIFVIPFFLIYNSVKFERRDKV